MKFQPIATFEYAYNRYLELAEQDNYYSKVYLKDNFCYPLATFNDLHSIDVNYYNSAFDVINYSWVDDVIIFMLQLKEV